MFNRVLQAVLATGLTTASLINAHDAKLHKGNATQGEIVSIAGDTVVLKMATGNLTVTLNKDTKMEMGDLAVDINHFKKGDKVSVIGTKLATGELVAKELLMAPAKTKAAAHTEGDHHK